MKSILLCMLLFCFSAQLVKAQVSESFDDGDFSSNPAWTGNTADWIITPALKLQSNNTTVNSSFYLSTPNTLAITAQWEVSVNLAFNTSSTNYTDIYLIASAADLSATNTFGYFVRLGGSTDEISLYKKNANGSSEKIIDGADGILNTSNNTLKIKVTRNEGNLFVLWRDLTGTGNAYSSEGSVTDATFTTSAFFGILVKQSTASFFLRHLFDDIRLTQFVPDLDPPAVISATAISNNQVDVLFNEPVDVISGQVAANYVAGNGIGQATVAVVDGTNSALVHLSFANSFPNGNSPLTITGVQDLAGNSLTSSTVIFYIYTPQKFDVVIDEIFADPTPQVGLPNSEWIELKNTASFPVNLQGWRVGDASGLSGSLPSFVLQPDSFVILCTSSAQQALSAFGTTLSVSNFPSLDNIGKIIYLQSDIGQVIHSVQYNVSWFQNELKQNGGWSLEMVDTKNPCSGITNWKASLNLSGGTPGKKNSEDAVNPDVSAPQLMRAYATDSVNMVLVFNEPLDSASAGVKANYSFSDGLATPVGAICVTPAFTTVKLKLAIPLTRNKVYTVTAQNVTDCSGNLVGIKKSVKVGLSALADSLNIVINEILFNPPSGGYDYVELYNKSNKIIDLSQTYIANRSSTGAVSSITQLSGEPYLLFPEDFLVISENTAWIKQAYITKNPDALLDVASMPSYNDDDGDVILLNGQGKITDEVLYSDKWHFKLLDNKEGVALERIDYAGVSSIAANWHSAASNTGYGTPSYKNSQFRAGDAVQGEIKVTPEIVSPDNDGLDDFATIQYNFPDPGYVANITMFDASGRPVRYLQRNSLCGTQGNFRWDGLGEKGQRLPTGVYVIVTEVFNLSGKKKQFKTPIVLARRN